MGNAHLVGSVPLENSEAVFTFCCREMGATIKRLPDGETGIRSNWIGWQRAVFANCPQLELVSEKPKSQFKVKQGTSPADINLPKLGYSQSALASYADFRHLKATGVIPEHVKFQVSLPTPLAPIQFYISNESREELEPIYENSIDSRTRRNLE